MVYRIYMKQLLRNLFGFIARPVIRLVQYRMLKVMKRAGSARDGRPAIAVAGYIIEDVVLPSVFHTFSAPEFRELANFSKLPVAEHDRIFNEVQVAGFIVAEHALVTGKQLVRDGDFHFWSRVEEQYPRQLYKIFTGFGLDSQNAKLLKELVYMRQKEYDRFAQMVWDSGTLFAPDVKANIEAEYGEAASEAKRIFSAVHGVAFGTVDHIRRGEVAERDPLVRYLFTWLLQLHAKVGSFVRTL